MELKLNDIAGYDLEKEKLKEIIEMFKSYKEYKKLGLSLSKGLILSGDPGVGKTLFARVLANELDAPFYYLDGSKMNNHSGVHKINKMFKRAYRNAPSVIFIDELNTFIGDSYYKSDITKRNLSTLLKLIDGIDKKEGIFVIGASSDKQYLDSAILRSGRMDKHICIPSPNLKSRIEIFNYYLDKVDIDKDDIDVRYIMEQADGLNGADIKTLINEAALEALYNKEPLNDDILLSNVRKIIKQDLDRKAENSDLSYYAYHDLAHMIAARELLGRYDEISIEHENDSLGDSSIAKILSNYCNDDDDDYDDDDDDSNYVESLSKEDVLGLISILLASRAIEEVKYNTYYLKTKDDIRAAIKQIYNSFDAGLFGLEYANASYYSYEFEVSMENMAKLENKKSEILNQQYQIALDIVKRNIDNIDMLHRILMNKKHLSVEEIEDLLS